jgi:hypothetical protein
VDYTVQSTVKDIKIKIKQKQNTKGISFFTMDCIQY